MIFKIEVVGSNLDKMPELEVLPSDVEASCPGIAQNLVSSESWKKLTKKAIIKIYDFANLKLYF